MKALTLWRPWTWAITHPSPMAKRVENRSWPPPPWMIGRDVAIHAGRKFDADAALDIEDILGEAPPDESSCPTGVVALARINGYLSGPGREYIDGPWYVGPFGWSLADVRVLARPVECKGAQGLWDLPADIEAHVKAQIAEAAHG